METISETPCLSLLGCPLSEYRIVRSAEASGIELYFVGLLQRQIGRAGYELDVVTDTEAPVEREIVVGCTSRLKSHAFYEASRELYEYAIVGYGSSLYIGYGSMMCLNEVLAVFPRAYDNERIDITGKVSNTFCVDKKSSSDIRVMTSNVEFFKWDYSKKDYKLRMRMTAEYYNFYKPDVIGLQEARVEMRDALTPYLDSRYKYVDFSQYTDEVIKVEYLPILYDAEKWTVLEAGVGRWQHILFCAWGYGWVRFGRKDDPTDSFYMINLHYMPAPFIGKYSELYRSGIASEVNERVKELVADEPDVMIFITGDYNTARNSDIFELMYENGHLETSYLLTEDTNLTSDNMQRWIDHISVTKDNVEVVLNRSINTIGTEYMSDHVPCFSDIKRKK